MKSLVGSLVRISVKTRSFSGKRWREGWGCELKGLWQGYFQQLMNNEAEREAVVTSMGTEAGRGQFPCKGK